MSEHASDRPRPVFIGGCGRSGTTMLGAMLGTHADCLTTPEASFFFTPIRRQWRTGERLDLSAALQGIASHWSFRTWDVALDREEVLRRAESYPDLLLEIVGAFGRKAGRTAPSVWVDHAPGNVKYASLLFDMFPSAKLIHIVRDGRATAASVIDLDWGPNNVASAARWWVAFVSRGLAVESMYGQRRVLRVVYEDLVREPEKTLRAICEFVGLDFRPEMIEGTGFRVPGFTADQHALVGRRPRAERLEAWRRRFGPREVEIYESIAADLLIGLGYETQYGWRARRMTASEKLRLVSQELFRRNVVNRMRLRRRIHRAVTEGGRR